VNVDDEDVATNAGLVPTLTRQISFLRLRAE
jgi:hypothetical protein